MGWLFGGMFEKIVHRIKKIVAFFEKANLNSPIQEPAILKGGEWVGGGGLVQIKNGLSPRWKESKPSLFLLVPLKNE